MKLITRIELQARSDGELSALFACVSGKLTGTAKGSAARRNALATLENIRREQAARQALRPR